MYLNLTLVNVKTPSFLRNVESSQRRTSVNAMCLESIIMQIIRGDGMKTILKTVGVLVILGGVVFFLQGINILPGSYMTGDRQWAINGGVMTIIGIGLMFWANRRK